MAAQQPTPAQAEQALRNPAIAAQVRERLQASGLSNDEIRARLKAAGYSEALLDKYLPGTTGDAPAPSATALSALQQIGVIEAAAQEGQRPVPANAVVADTQPRSAIFGLDIFRSSTSRFDPLTAGPVDANYKVGPRDVLALILTGGVEASYTLEVTGEGYVVIPQVGQVYVANLTLDQIRDLLHARMGRVYSGLGRGADAATRLTVSVARVRANQVFVIGEATVPGSYQVSSAGSMLTALYTAGGPTANGGMRAVELRRGGRVVGTLDLYDYLVRGDASRDERLESGDIIFIPFHGKRVSVHGEVGRQATFEMREGETLRDLVRFAGGLAPTASRHRIQIRRILAPEARSERGMERVVLDIPADQLAGGAVPAFPLEPGDQVQVFGVSDVERNIVTVVGHVWAPGELGLRTGMRISEAIRAAGGVRPGTFLDQVLVSRHRPGTAPQQLRTTLANEQGAVTDDIVLAEGDSVHVFSRAEFSEERYVNVAGAVRGGGRIPYRDGMTLRDAVLLAGGLSESAYLREAEIARLRAGGDDGLSATTFRLSLDSTYLFERGPDGEYLGPPGREAPAGGTKEVVLQPYDQVLILRRPDWDIARNVKITGEVRFPGTYTLVSANERLTDVIRRAGGVREHAYAGGTSVFRRADSLGRINVHLPTALRRPTSPDNVVLLDGDSIHVPRYTPVVKVSGAVSSPSSITYVRGQPLSYYVAVAGGALHNGDLGRAYVEQPNGTRAVYRRRWGPIPNSDPVPEPGAQIVVPVKPEDNRPSDRLAATTQVLTALATLALLITRL